MELPTDIAKICSMEDGALRNLFITQRYHDLSAALAEVMSEENVNWSTFATWASKTAGESIRNEEVPPFVADLVTDAGDDLEPHFGKIGSALHAILPTTGFHASFVLAPVEETLAEVSTSIARGNLKVFKELAPEFVLFVRTFRDDLSLDEKKLAAYLSHFKPGPPANDGQDLLKRAFDAYARARFEENASTKARMILYANCLVGLHEQTRLQPDIKTALDAPIEEILEKHLHDSVRASAHEGIFGKLVDAIAEPLEALTNEIKPIWQRIATRYMMRLALPYGEDLPLGKDIPRSAASRSFLPVQLQNITRPDDLVALLAQYDRARGNSDVGSASVDWANLDDRMNFIVNLFRSSQQDEDLFVPPFAPEQVASFTAGKMPDGKL
jgi:hypothetical protein